MRLFDMHCDTLYECSIGGYSLSENELQLDLTRGLAYNSWAQVFAVWMPDTLRGNAAWIQCRSILELAQKETILNPKFRIIYNEADLDFAIQNNVCAAVLAVEGGSALAGNLETLGLLASMGVKIITLTWNGSNELGHGCESLCNDGLTEFGKKAIKAMEKLNIIPDVSHLNQAGFWDVMENTNNPIIASHSVSAAICDHPRNLTDDQFKAIMKRGGVVGLNLCESHLGEQSFECLQKHLEHYLSLGGEHTVAFGCDFDGTDLPPEWGGIEVMEKIYEYFQRKNYEESLLDRLFFGNCYDFFHSALTSTASMV